MRAKAFTLDGAAVVTGENGIAAFDVLHRRRPAILYAFDLLDLNGEDLRLLPLGDRKGEAGAAAGAPPAHILFSEHADEEGAVVFRHACKLGEGIVSKRLSASYRSGPSRD